MKLYLKQKFFSWKDQSTVKDELGNDKYYIEGKVFSVGKKLRIYDPNGTERAFVRQKVASFMPRFIVEIGGEEKAMIVKKFSFFKPKYYVQGPEWEVMGDVFGHDYTVSAGEIPVVSVHKKWMSWGDVYELDIADNADEILALATVLAIDAVLDAQENAAATT